MRATHANCVAPIPEAHGDEDFADDVTVALVKTSPGLQSEENSRKKVEDAVKLTCSQVVVHIEALKIYFLQQNNCSSEVLQLT